MKIVVTGGAGFIGSNVVDTYVEAGHEVLIIDNLSTGKEENLNTKANFEKIDIRDKKVHDIISSFSPDVINHIAAQIDVRKSLSDPVFNAEVNELGMLNILETAVKTKAKKLLFSSTGGAIYGEIKEKDGADEGHPQEPISPYAITKRAGELYLYAYHVNYGLNYTVLRYGNVYGPRQDPLGEAGVNAIFCGKMLKGEIPTIYGDGKQLRDYLFVKDVAQINLIALKKGDNTTYNIGRGIGISVNELFKHLKELLNFTGEAIYASPRAGELFRSVLNCKKAERELGWKAEVDIRKGLELTLHWYKEKQNIRTL
ncbi:UDP-glucose 4-epimerase [candidate division WOR-1 bacterium RIFOXYA2_FULL_36_21]|uniref:UDP-glucose 4-epimerase n=1 Tax=candidate division WOR-1 bacterium RIFOXYB2_FULL_36_35 TaxID=1802578 RepID=A0A1F4S429_UNCSA|nr:MAG: UDP-glucose 4-epimerase [candidate division WOR-1 bacterium RIFOXYA2_FULL_36_21]OGC15140.1 MAG: UDP-glucose 4-epimerase [candidate division WOR-1 bacterium RIFOXYA12_FULL_36_13]OGC15160.1 MAG: UDP-glucose 4-epimerase [candidate division WOR-1 bacterium RIFOXYB2_FULL_36_35]